jgi:galactose mutarotase-like enzyme
LDNGLLAEHPVAYLKNINILPLKKELFVTDALVFKNLNSDKISIKNKKDQHGLDFHFSGYPFFGIWAAKDADFVCLEPWQGVTDSVLSDGRLEHKEGILKLNNDETFTCSWKAVCY